MTIQQLDSAIEQANQLQGKLTPEVIAVESMTSPKIKYLLNKIVEIEGNYFEVGTWKGGMLTAALFKNNARHICIDNFSQFTDGKDIKAILLNNCQSVLGYAPNLIQQDAWAVDLNQIQQKFGVFIYDGYHSFECQRRAVSHFLPVLEREYVMVVDDFDTGWGVKDGTFAGIQDAKLQIVHHRHMAGIPGQLQEWWTGLGVFILRKP